MYADTHIPAGMLHMRTHIYGSRHTHIAAGMLQAAYADAYICSRHSVPAAVYMAAGTQSLLHTVPAAICGRIYIAADTVCGHIWLQAVYADKYIGVFFIYAYMRTHIYSSRHCMRTHISCRQYMRTNI